MNKFLWGVATSAYQIEGDSRSRGRSNWDDFCTKPGAVFEGHDANRASGHVRRLDEDLDLIAALGVDVYRFSLSWPRLLPNGTGQVSTDGLAFYDRLIEGLLRRGVEPLVTLFHWDYPAELETRGAWRNPDSVLWFEEYVSIAARHFGDRVRRWLTINEPHAYIEGGLRHGRHAPGYKLPLSEVLPAAHRTLLAHGSAVRILRREVRDTFISAAPVLLAGVPERVCPEDEEAARRYTFSMPKDELRVTSFWMDPIYGRGYPPRALELFEQHAPDFSPDERGIYEPVDAVGFNLYDAVVVRANAQGEPEVVPFQPGNPRTAFQWPITPQAHYYGPRFVSERYGLPAFVTENGLSCRDWVTLDGTVPDAERVDFLERHVGELLRARTDGVPILGYLHWSLLDNFEWNHGYRERFGLIHVDFETLERTPKQSFYAYRDMIHRARTETTLDG